MDPSPEITLRERGPIGTQSEGDLRLDVVVVSEGFTGRNEAAWGRGKGVQNRVSFRLEVDPSALLVITGEIGGFRNAS